MPTDSKMPVSSFGPKMLQALLTGATRELVLTFSPPGKAIYFSQRINMLRSAMRREKHELTALVYRAKCVVERNKDGSPTGVVRILPRDVEFEDALDGAGVELPTLSPDVLVSPLPTIEGGTPSAPLPWELTEGDLQ